MKDFITSLSSFLNTATGLLINLAMDEAKIHFSPAETELMCNAGMILTKNKILYGIKQLLESIEQKLLWEAHKINDGDVKALLQSTPKISKGENYLGLPYLVLDYPRQFDLTNIFAVRTMFWWGHFFSSTLHLAGAYKEIHLEKIETAYRLLAKQQYYICINEDPWMHHFEEENYKQIDTLSEETFVAYCREYEHLKIAAKWSLRDVHFVDEDLIESWKILLKICGNET